MHKSKAGLVHKHFKEIEGTIYGPCLSVVIAMRSLASDMFEIWLDNGDRIEVPYWHELTIL